MTTSKSSFSLFSFSVVAVALSAGLAGCGSMQSQDMVRANTQLGTRAVQQMLTGVTDIMALAASRTAGQSIARQAKLVRTMTRSASTASQLSASAAQLAQRGLTPIHARATANAKRLGKR